MTFTASSIMRSKLVICNTSDSLKEVARTMINEKVGSVLIEQDDNITGIIIDRDILKAVVAGKNFEKTLAAEIMSSPLECCQADDSLDKCNELFQKTHHSRLIVKEGDKVVGILLRKFVERFLNMSKRYSLAEIAHTPRPRPGR